MRFARVVSAHDCLDPVVDELVEKSDLDVLQLDYRWPSIHASDERLPLSSYAYGFLEQLRTLHKTLYLEPGLHIVTNAGGGDGLGCVEAVAEYLCEHDDANLLMTSIRGDNVLAHLEEIMAESVELRDINTAIPLPELTRPLLAAQIEIGAGPLKAALDEGSRLVVAGCYDEAAPVLAAATSATGLTWDRTDKLAQLAIAARCQQSVVEIDDMANLEMYGHPIIASRTHSPESQVLESTRADGLIHHADVRYQASDCEFYWLNRRVEHPPRIKGQPSTGNWLLRIAYIAEYFAEAYWEFDESENKQADRTFATLREFLNCDGSGQPLQLDLMRPKYEEFPSMIRARYRSQDQASCENFVRAVNRYVARTRWSRGPSLGAPPQILCRAAQFCCDVPRDAIAISVDTRPAKEWR